MKGKELAELKQQIFDSIQYLKEVKRSFRYRPVFCIAIKQHYRFDIDIQKFVDTHYPERKEQIIEWLEEAVPTGYRETMERLSVLHDDWLSNERRYIFDEFLRGCTISGQDYYKKLKEKIEAGEETGYPALHECETKEKALEMVERWAERDKEQEFLLSELDINTAGVYGQNGELFGILPKHGDISNDLENILDELPKGIDLDKDYSNYKSDWGKDLESLIADYQYIESEVRAVRWVLKEVHEIVEGLDFTEELEFRIGEQIIEWEEEEAKTKIMKALNETNEIYQEATARAIEQNDIDPIDYMNEQEKTRYNELQAFLNQK
jgi:predicted  nucleic acid-binding Zn-ribbon protein